MRSRLVSISAFAFILLGAIPALGADRAPKSIRATPRPASAADSTAKTEAKDADDSKVSVSAAPAFVLPIGNLSNVAGVGLGGLLGVQKPVLDRLSVGGRAGFVYHFSKEIPGFSYGISEIPILGNARYTFVPTSDGGLYGAAELGLSIIFSRATVTANVPYASSFSGSSSDVRVSTALGVGYQLDKLDLRASLYMLDLGHLGDSMSLMATAGYSFAAF